jgi:hypothetical protein
MHWSSMVVASADCVASTLTAELSSFSDPDRWEVCKSAMPRPKTGRVFSTVAGFSRSSDTRKTSAKLLRLTATNHARWQRSDQILE